MCFKTTTVLIYRMNISSTLSSIELRVLFGIGQWSYKQDCLNLAITFQ